MFENTSFSRYKKSLWGTMDVVVNIILTVYNIVSAFLHVTEIVRLPEMLLILSAIAMLHALS